MQDIRPVPTVSPGLRILRVVGISLAYLLLCALLATLLAYPAHQLTHGVISIRAGVSRGSLILLVLGLVPWCRFLGLTRRDVGITGGWRAFPRGFGLGVLMLGLHSGVLLLLGIRVSHALPWLDVSHGLRSIGQALGVAFLVAVVEEILFRGVMLAAFSRAAGRVTAVLLSATYYALLHFFRADPRLDIGEPGWSSGFNVLQNALQHLLAAPVDALLALFFAGLLLALVRLQAAMGLVYCMGLHAGWVFVIRLAKPLTDAVPTGEWSFLVGSYDGFTGYLAAGWMGVLSLITGMVFYRNSRRDRIAGS